MNSEGLQDLQAQSLRCLPARGPLGTFELLVLLRRRHSAADAIAFTTRTGPATLPQQTDMQAA
ncbi:hypothetical protein PC116_g22129 [Phytophthora cactorum]|uniref:Uncharacterized protein n=1 Tax=Phytophthora cactorum TaxID=29920 RepID=A0A8T1K5V8_9STRA|nr:hypothetical protein Pcac1_g12645 [Phytophthora cactorum]KAG2885199.1 hypothetical protein PC114_g19799 [Phytophthora cactorum]KAG2910361.1 hypothetical protein PC117_g19429 [Phytophthora cactorum]KAG2989290.1 hypothetical protein PC119_g19326 [Phytophthora cactorum]KAG3140059.1 hypothetical protein C6341_g20118 [Phytophthora cactorum]